MEVVERHEGTESARLFAHWHAQQPLGLRVLRDLNAELVGLVQHVDVDCAQLAAAALADPCFAGLAGYFARVPLRAGERGRVTRFWMSTETHHAPSPFQHRIFAHQWQRLCFSAEVSVGCTVVTEPQLWLARPDRLHKHYSEADFELDGRQFGVFGLDWRRTPRHGLVQRYVTLASGERTREPEEIYEVLDAQQFAAGVKEALRRFGRPDRLCDNPLLQTRIVVGAAGAGAGTADRVAALRALLREACAGLAEQPGTQRHWEVMQRAYLDRQDKGVAVAGELGMAFATYRYYVAEGARLVCDTLWRRELSHDAA